MPDRFFFPSRDLCWCRGLRWTAACFREPRLHGYWIRRFLMRTCFQTIDQPSTICWPTWIRPTKLAWSVKNNWKFRRGRCVKRCSMPWPTATTANQGICRFTFYKIGLKSLTPADWSAAWPWKSLVPQVCPGIRYSSVWCIAWGWWKRSVPD